MNQDEVKRNLLSVDQWIRMLLMAGYLLVAWVLSLVLVVIMVTGELNANLQRFGAIATAYLYQIVIFLVYGTDDKPFPFSPLPGGDTDEDDAPATTAAAHVDEPASGNDDPDQGTQNQT
jgi:hypothetical protein